MKFIISGLVGLCVLGFANLTFAQSKPPLKFRVMPLMMFDGDDATNFKQCLFRELRKIPEVVVVEDRKSYNRFILDIMIMRALNKGGTAVGYVASAGIYVPINAEFVTPMISDKSDRPIVEMYLAKSVVVEATYIRIDPSYESMCKDLVATFETKHVEPLRQIWQSQ